MKILVTVKELNQTTPLITFKAKTTQLIQQNKHLDFLHRDLVEIYLSHECSLKIIPEIEIVLISHLRNTTRHIISNNQNQCSSINWLQEFMNHQKFLKTNGYQTLSKIYEFLVSNYFFLLILTFSSSPKSVIVVAIIFINSSRITFGLKYHILF